MTILVTINNHFMW